MKALLSTQTLLLSVALTGCAASMNPIGEAKFDCNRKQDAKSEYCRSFKAVEAATASDVPESRFDREFKLSDIDKLTGISPDTPPQSPVAASSASMSTSAARTNLLPHQVRENPPLAGMPVREGPVVQRTWIKRFVDGRDVLTEDTVVYREIVATRWAGFDQNPQELTQAQYYPHRATEITSGPNVQKLITQNQVPPTPAPEFKQPGVATELQESATVPAVSGTSSTSMPQ